MMKTWGIKSLVAATLVSILLGFANAEGEPAVDLSKFRFALAEMQDIASPTKLRHRIFYEAPSTGENAQWFDAIKQGNLALVTEMVANGQDIEAKDSGSLDQTALGWAAFIGYQDIVDFLVAEGANLWATDKGDVYHALKSAALGKNVQIVKEMREALREQYDINDTSYEDDGESLVMVAASNNRLEVVQYLIDQGADLNIVTTIEDPTRFFYNQSALSYACQQGYEEMQQLLIKEGAINHRTGDTTCQ